MKTISGLVFTFVVLFSCTKNIKKMSFKWPQASAPIAEKKAHLRTIHGESVDDPYYWMYDFFGKGPDSDKVVSYLTAENTYLKTMMAATEPLQKQLFEEMKGRIKEKDESVPHFLNGYYYYSRTEEGQQYYKYCRKKGSLEAPEEVLLDVDALAKDKAYYAIGGTSISEDNTLLAFAVDEVSRRQYTIYVKNLATGELLSDEIKNTEGDPVWANDNKTLFYTAKNPLTLLSEKIYRHVLGQKTDELVYHEKDNTNYIGVGKSKNGKWLMIYSSGTLSSEIRLLDADKPSGDFKAFAPRKKEVLYEVTPLADRFLITTNEQAENFKVMQCPLNQTAPEFWKEYLPHDENILIESLSEFENHVVVQQRKNGLIALNVIDLKTGEKHLIGFDESTYDAGLGANPNYFTEVLRFNYTSLVTPASVFDYNLNTKKRQLKKQAEVLGGYDPAAYTSERLYVKARDGQVVPMSIVYKKGFKKDGKSPVLLYAYGSYGNSIDAAFRSTRLSLLDRGFAFAIAHIRGGQEIGRKWYLEGKLMKKMNTFYDFVDCADFLIEQNFTSAQHLYANGGSAGGLLMGVVANIAPDRFNGIIADVPFVDVVNTMLDEDIPLTTNEYDEWGNPNEKAAYDYMKSYSPYENVKAQNYPNMLVTTGLHDSQVQYFEPAKWVAKLRDTKTDNNILLLHTNMEFGHGGASGRFDYLKDIALNWAFLLALEGGGGF